MYIYSKKKDFINFLVGRFFDELNQRTSVPFFTLDQTDALYQLEKNKKN